MQSNKMGEFLNSLIELESHGELKKRMLTYLRARENVAGLSSGLDGVIPDPSPLNFQLGNHCATMPNPLRYINPFVATERLGYLPPAISGEAPHRPTWEEQYKTVMCESWLADGSCPYGRECRFAHGENEIRPIGFRPQPHNRRKYKTKLCEKYTKNGICPYGENCFFIHPDPNNPDDQRFFELSRRYHQISEQLVSHVRTAGRNGFSISVPVNPRAAVQALLQKESLPRLKTDTELLNGFSIDPASIGTLSDAFTAYRDFPSSILTPSSTSNSGETSPLPTLKNQVLENLRKQNDTEFMPPEEPKSTYDPFKSFDFPQSFAASFSSFNHRC